MNLGLLVAVAAPILLIAGSAHAGVAQVPEPASVTLLGVGAAAVAVVVWWRNRK